MVYGIPGKKVMDDVPKTSDEENKKQAKEAGESKAAMAEEAWRAKAPAAGPVPKFSLPVAEKGTTAKWAYDLPGAAAQSATGGGQAVHDQRKRIESVWTSRGFPGSRRTC